MLEFIKKTKQLNITDTLIIIVLYMFQKCVVHSIIKLSYFYIFTDFLRLEFLFDFTSMCGNWETYLSDMEAGLVLPFAGLLSPHI